MKDFIILVITLLFLQISTQAQESGRLSIGLGPNLHTGMSRVGVSGYVKWLTPGVQDMDQGFVFTAKATHTPPGEGSFFKLTGDGDNVTSGHLLAGYRVQWPAVAPGSAFYAEANAGIGMIGSKKIAFSILPQIGYSFNEKWGIFGAYQGAFANEGLSLNLIELGVAFSFRL